MIPTLPRSIELITVLIELPGSNNNGAFSLI